MRGHDGLRYACIALFIAASVAYASREDGDRYSGKPACGLGETQLEYGCACAPGFGGFPCKPCNPGFYSPGGNSYDPRPACVSCGPHFTSPKAATAASQCSCEPGFGAQLLPMEHIVKKKEEEEENWAYAQGQQQQQQGDGPAHSRRLMAAAAVAAADRLFIPTKPAAPPAVDTSKAAATPVVDPSRAAVTTVDPSKTAAAPVVDPSRAAATVAPNPAATPAADAAGKDKAASGAKPDPKNVVHTTGGVGDDSPMTPRARVIKFKKGGDAVDSYDPQQEPANKEPSPKKAPVAEDPYKREEPSKVRNKEPVHIPRWSSKGPSKGPSGSDRPAADKPPAYEYEPHTVNSHTKYGYTPEDQPQKQYTYEDDSGPKTVGSHKKYGYVPEDDHKHGEEPEEHTAEPGQKKQYEQDKKRYGHDEEEQYSKGKEQYKQGKDKPSKQYEQYEEEPPKKQDKPSKHYVEDNGEVKPPKHYIEEPRKQPYRKERQDREQYGQDKEQYRQDKAPKHYIDQPREPRYKEKPAKQWVEEPDIKELIEEQERRKQEEYAAAEEEIKTISSYDKYNYKPEKDDPENYQQIPADDWVERQQQQAVKDDASQQQQPGMPPDQVQPEGYEYRGNEYTDSEFKYRQQEDWPIYIYEQRQQPRPTAAKVPQVPSQEQKPMDQARVEPETKAPEVRGIDTGDTIHKDRLYDPLADLRKLQKEGKKQETPVATSPQDAPARYNPLSDLKHHGHDDKHADEYPRQHRDDPFADMRYHAQDAYDADREYLRGSYGPDTPRDGPQYDHQEPQTVGSYHKYHFEAPANDNHRYHAIHDLPRKPREEYEPQDPQELYGINHPEPPRDDYEQYQQQQQREQYERQQQQQREQYQRQQQQQPQYSPKPRQQPIKEYLPSPAQQPTHDTDGWWDEKRDQAVRKRGPQGSGRDDAKPVQPVLDDKPVRQYDPSQYEPQQGPKQQLQLPEQSNQQYEQQAPRWYQKAVFEDDTVIEKFGRKWDTKVCAPCPRGLYSVGTPGYTPAQISSSTAAANTTAAVAGSTAGSPSGSTAGSTVSVAALSPETKASAAAAAAKTQAATAQGDAAAASYSYNSYYSSPASKPRAQLCERCMGADKAPGGFVTPKEGASSLSMCGCAAGHGGSNCKPCEEGFYSEGGRGVECVSCPNGGHGFTTVPKIAARDVDDCVCLAGHGFNGEGCEVCPQGTWSRGFSRAPCKPCKPGLMSPAGSSTPEACVPYDWECPLGQWAPAGAMSPEECRCYPGYGGVQLPGVPCHICQPGTYSEGNDRGPCLECPRGKTSSPGAWSDISCYSASKCPSGAATPHEYRALLEAVKATAGVSIASVGSGSDANVNATTATVKVRKQRVYRTTPPEGDSDVKASAGVLGAKVKIDPEVFAWKPAKQAAAPKQAPVVSAAPVKVENTTGPKIKTEDPNVKAEELKSEAEEKVDSYYEESSSPDSDDYYAYKSYINTDTCVCKPGHGSNRGAGPCHQCPTGTWSAGGANTPCQPCPSGYISDPGADSEHACFETRVECAPGQYAPEDAKSTRDCVCKPGYGGKGNHWSQCTICPAGTFSSGGSLEPCMLCPSKMAAPEGSIDVSYCHPHNICPVGTWVPDSFSFYSGDDDKVLPGLAAVASVQAKTNQFLDLGGPSANTGSSNKQQQQAKPADNSGLLDIGFVGGFGDSGKPAPAAAKNTPTPQKPAAAALPTRGSVPNSSSRRNSYDSPTPYSPVSNRGDGRSNGGRDNGYGEYDKGSSSNNVRPYYPQRSFEGWWDTGSMFAPSARNYSRSGPRRCQKGQWDLFDPTGTSGYGADCHEDYYHGHENQADNYDSMMDDDFIDWILAGKKKPQSNKNNGYNRYGYDKDGYDQEGYDRDGYNREGKDPYGFDRRGSFHAPRSGDDKRSRQDRLADEWYGDDGSDSYGSDRGDRKYYDHNAVDDYGKQKQGQQRGEKQKHQEDLEKYGEKRNDEWYYDLVPPVHASVKDCKCKPGYGLMTDKSGSSCKMCEPGSYNPGNGLEPCQDCPPGYTSSFTSTHAKHCVPLFKECGPGGYVPEGSKGKAAECKCYPGYGLQMSAEDERPVCDLCPPGTYSEGHARSGCSVCPEDKTSHPGSWRKDQCHTMSHYGAGDYQSLFAAAPHSSDSLASTAAKGTKGSKALARAWSMRMKPHNASAKAAQATAAAAADKGASNATASSTQQVTPQQQQQKGATASAAEPAVAASSSKNASSS